LPIAISTVLNNPHKLQAPPKAHSALPPVVPAQLPRVRIKDFDPYLQSLALEWPRFQSNLRAGPPGFELDDSYHGETSHPNSSQTLANNGAGRPLPPLNSVPSIFFVPNFNLGDQTTFDAVTEQSSDASIDPSSLSHSLPLLEKFSHYADTVEQHLVREVSLRSTSFFAALTNLRDLQSESDQCLNRVDELRALLKDVDEKCAKRGLEIVVKEQKLRKLQAIKDGLKTVRNAVDMTNVARTLASSGQWSDALEVIEDLKTNWAPKSTTTETPLEKASQPGIDNGDTPDLSLRPKPDVSPKSRMAFPLSSLQAFAALPVHLRDLTIEITSSLSSEVVDVLRLDLTDRINGVRNQPEGDSHGIDLNKPVMDRLRPLLNGLVRTKGLQEVIKPWREAIMEEVRAVMKRVSLVISHKTLTLTSCR
jgi:vacuolar protein sorting-associated protein 54